MTTIVAFARDLRVGDHATLARAAERGDVVPVFVIDPVQSERLRISPRRAAFFCAALAALADAIAARGGRLIVRRGPIATTLRALARGIGAERVAWTVRYGAHDLRAQRDTQAVLEEAGIGVLPVHDALAIPPEDAGLAHRQGDGWRSFAAYYERWRTLVPIYPESTPARFAACELASEALPQPAEFGSMAPLPTDVGEDAARAKLSAFLGAAVLNYGAARNVPAAGPTALLSADLSFGTLGPRTVVAGACERAADPFLLVEERTAIRLWLRALAQRDFFLQLAWFNDALDERPLQQKMRGFTFARSHAQLDAWRAGNTGFPLVDAGIRELHATGAMHPRIRAIAASFLCFDLGVDWRIGRDEWDRYLIEDSPALASANWQWSAGVGADLAAYPRIYNPLKQARRFDPAAGYIRRWIPELAASPDALILGRDREERQLGLPLFGGRAYPEPMLDHEAAARAFLARYARETADT